MSRRQALLPVLLLTIAVCGVLHPAAPALGQTSSVTYRPPVDAPVVDPFRAPASPYGPGNRGIEYATVPGTTVRTIAPGTVVFAGSVAGTRYVTVLHADGLRSSYGFLESLSVAAGAVLRAGAEVGRAGDRLHLGVRRGDEYLDPETLFAQAAPQVRLIPVSAFDDPGDDDETALLPLGAALALRLVAEPRSGARRVGGPGAPGWRSMR